MAAAFRELLVKRDAENAAIRQSAARNKETGIISVTVWDFDGNVFFEGKFTDADYLIELERFVNCPD